MNFIGFEIHKFRLILNPKDSPTKLVWKSRIGWHISFRITPIWQFLGASHWDLFSIFWHSQMEFLDNTKPSAPFFVSRFTIILTSIGPYYIEW
jgi:hypothetical protein